MLFCKYFEEEWVRHSAQGLNHCPFPDDGGEMEEDGEDCPDSWERNPHVPNGKVARNDNKTHAIYIGEQTDDGSEWEVLLKFN